MLSIWLSMTALVVAWDPVPPAVPSMVERLQMTAESQPNDPARWLALARELDRLGNEDAAIRTFEKAKTLPAAREALGRYSAIDDANLAAEHYREAADAYELAHDQSGTDRCRREVVRLTGDIKVLRQLLAGDASTNRITANQLPELVGKCGRPATLVPDLKRWADALPKLAGPIAALAECERNESRLLTWLEDHSDPIAYASLARLQTKKPEQLVALLRESDPGQPDRAKAIMAGLQTEPAAVVALLKKYPAPQPDSSWPEDSYRVVRLGIAGNCIDVAESTLKSWLPARPANALSVYDALLMLYGQAGQFSRAEQLSRRCIKEYQDEFRKGFYFHQARALMHLDREEDALAAATEVVKRGTGVRQYLLQIEVLSWFGQHDAAQTVARKAFDEFRDRDSEMQLRMRLASLAEYRGDNAAAEGHLLRVLELSPKDALAHNNLGYFWADQNRRLDDAERLCRFAVDQGRESIGGDDPGGDEAAYRDSLGWVYFRQGRLIAAQEQIEQALALPGGKLDAVVWEHYGDILAARGKHDRAIVAWTNAVQHSEKSRTHRDDPRPALLKHKLASASKSLN